MSQTAAPPSSKIFISYRRDDSAGHTGRLYDRLSAHFGEDQIFMDIEHIEVGEDFVQAIRDAVGECEILIAVIGRDWLKSGDANGRRIDNPNDFVRLEIATALERDIRVIPVLVEGAKMPQPQDLPENLLRLSQRNAIELSDTRWKHDVNQLIEALEKVFARQRAAQSKAAAEAEAVGAERQRLETEARRQEEARAEAEEARRREASAEEARKNLAAEEARKRRAREEAQQKQREAEAEEIKRRRAAEREPLPVERYKTPSADYAAQQTQSKRKLALVVIALLVVAAFGVAATILISSALTPSTGNANVTASKSPSPDARLQSNSQAAQSTQPTKTNAAGQALASTSPTPKGKTGDKAMTTPAVTRQEEEQPSKLARNTNNTDAGGRAAKEKEEPPPPTPKPQSRQQVVSGGVLNGKAINRPQPAYPAIAKAARASGTVTVRVTVDESGNVIRASAVGGHPLLQQAAVQAAYQARFSPTLLSGQPVKVSGVITYNFVLQ